MLISSAQRRNEPAGAALSLQSGLNEMLSTCIDPGPFLLPPNEAHTAPKKTAAVAAVSTMSSRTDSDLTAAQRQTQQSDTHQREACGLGHVDDEEACPATVW